MSSTKTRLKLKNERPDRPGEFTFTWSIHNYSYCTIEEDNCLYSPDFEVEFLGEDKCRLELYPKGSDAYDSAGFVSCFLEHEAERLNFYGHNPLISRLDLNASSFNFTLSIRTADGQFKEGNESIYDDPRSICNGYSKFLSIEDLKSPNGFLVNDTLTLRCRIWKTDSDIPISVKYDVHSKFKVSKLNYTWLLKDIAVSNKDASECEFNQSSDITDLFKGIWISKMNIFLVNEGSMSESDIYFGIEIKSVVKNIFLKCEIHFLDTNRKVVHSASSQQLFLYYDEMEDFKFPVISKQKFYFNKNVYAPRGQLTLQCQFSFATDHELETIEYGSTNDIALHPLSVTESDSKVLELWIKNMQQCYKDGKFSDFIIRTPGRQFPVNRTILGAHSKVFCAMFEHDMKERKSGVVEIEDLDDDTVSKMLMYIYTSTLDNIDCSTAQKLYLAADKYQITSLQKKCSIFLMGCIENSNVCDILELADTLQDQDLKSCARDFVQTHAKKIINSESWKKLMETNSALTSETIPWIVCKRFRPDTC